MVRQCALIVRHAIKAALFRNAVIAAHVDQRGLAKLLALRRYDVADIDQLVVPSMQGDEFGWLVDVSVGKDAALQRRDDLLAQRRERNNAELDLVAAGLPVIGDDLFDCHILFLDEALRPP